jgi:DNA-binding response OmpR family regulator
VTVSDNPIRILVIDDDPGVRGLLTILFKREGWTVITAADGEIAVQQMALERPDVVILDLMLPKLMGLEVLRQITAQDSTCGQRVLVVTAIAEAELRKLPADLGVWKVIRKPFDNAELVRTVQACGSRHARPRPRANAAI